MRRIILVVSLVNLLAYSAVAQTIVHTSKELQDILAKDDDIGIVLLDGDWFHLEGAVVNMGGKIKPYGKRKPVLIGFQQTVVKSKDTKERGGYWTAKVTGYGAANYIFIDDTFETIERSKKVDGNEFIHLKASDLQRMDKATRAVKIKIPSGYESLQNKSESDLKNAMLKVGYWFVQMNVYKLKSDGSYLYGQIDNNYNYDLLDIRPNANVTISFFNFPFEDGGIFIDGKDFLHVPANCTTARMCCSNNVLTLNGDRKLTIEGVTFVGSMKQIVIEGSNKHLNNCSFINCGSAIYCDYGVTNKEGKCSVTYCTFENLYNNNAITFVGCDDVIIANNKIHKTGTVNKGGCVIQVGGNQFQVTNNSIKGYSYIGIYAGISREYAAAKMIGCINENLVDNIENWGQADKQLTDGGGIYVIAHTDGLVIENNIVRNIGYDNAWMHGIYLDDGAYNVKVKRNLVYNINNNSKAIYSRYVPETERSCMNNVFEGNIFIGNCVMAGNQKGFGRKTVIKDNFIDGSIENSSDEHITIIRNHTLDAAVLNNLTIKINNKERIRKRKYSSYIRDLIKE